MKRVYHILALMALINLFAVAGLIGFLVYSGKLTRERADQIAAILRGEELAGASSAAASQPAATTTAPAGSRETIARDQARKELYALMAERHLREMEDRRLLNQQIQLDVNRQLEKIEQDKKSFEEQRQELAEVNRQDGFERELALFNSIDPKNARDQLKMRKDADAVLLMMKMDEGRARKVVDACKTDDEKLWIGRILIQMQKQDTLSDSGVDGPPESSPLGG